MRISLHDLKLRVEDCIVERGGHLAEPSAVRLHHFPRLVGISQHIAILCSIRLRPLLYRHFLARHQYKMAHLLHTVPQVLEPLSAPRIRGKIAQLIFNPLQIFRCDGRLLRVDHSPDIHCRMVPPIIQIRLYPLKGLRNVYNLPFFFLLYGESFLALDQSSAFCPPRKRRGPLCEDLRPRFF